MFIQCRKHKDFCVFVLAMCCLYYTCICMLCGRHESSGGTGMEREHMPAQSVQRGTWCTRQSGQLEGVSAFVTPATAPASSLPAPQGCTALPPAQALGSTSGTRGWPRALHCTSSAAGPSPASQNWDLGGKVYIKEVRGAFLEALLS